MSCHTWGSRMCLHSEFAHSSRRLLSTAFSNHCNGFNWKGWMKILSMQKRGRRTRCLWSVWKCQLHLVDFSKQCPDAWLLKLSWCYQVVSSSLKQNFLSSIQARCQLLAQLCQLWVSNSNIFRFSILAISLQFRQLLNFALLSFCISGPLLVVPKQGLQLAICKRISICWNAAESKDDLVLVVPL